MAEDDRGWMGPLPATTGCDCHVCRPDRAYDEHDRRVIDTVLQHGWQVMLVAADAACGHPDHDHDHAAAEDHGDPGPAFAYTIGLQHRAGHPELLVSGLEHNGVFAWQPGAPEVLDDLQPPAWRSPLTHTGGLAVDPSWDFPVPPEHPAFSCAHVVDDGAAILWAVRQPDEDRGED